ncbi:MAG: histidine kinase [Bacteroidota bacterium]
MEQSTTWEKRFLGIRFREWTLIVLFYFIFGMAYNLAIYTTSGGRSNFIPNIFIDYGLKALYTIPIWYVLFKVVADWKIWQKVMLHVVLCPIYVVLWQQTYYGICDYFDIWHLGWPAAWWDVYIPGQFYVLQFGIFHVYDFYIRLQHKNQLENELRELALRSELTALKSQLNPHFLYNTFNTISASVPAGQETTRELIARFSDLFRYQLKASKEELVSLGEELEFIETYLELEQARFGDRLAYQFEVPERLLKAKIPPMLLQPIVENAIKHGISPQIDGGIVVVKVMELGDQLSFQIRDSGSGYDLAKAQKSDGLGLRNTRKRLEKMYNAPISLSKALEGGLQVAFQIPNDLNLAKA